MIRDTVRECLPHKDPTAPPDYTEADVQAIRAVWNGNATAEQQRRCIGWMLAAFGTHDMSFRPSSDRLTSFAEGRRHAGTTIIYMLKTAETKTDSDKIAVRLVGERE